MLGVKWLLRNHKGLNAMDIDKIFLGDPLKKRPV